MRFGIRKSGMVLIFLSVILLSACAEGAQNDALNGTISKPGGDLALLGTVDGISENTWTVSGRTIRLLEDTHLESDLRIGDSVWVDVTLGDDGFMSALVIEASSLDMFVVGAEIEFYGVVREITPTLWLIGGVEVGVTPNTELKAEIVVGDLVEVHANFGEGAALFAREIELAEMDEEIDDHNRDEVEFFGAVEAISDGEWLVGDRAVLVTPDTEMDDEIILGDVVKVEAYENEHGSLVAHEIELLDEDSDIDLDADDDDDLDDADDPDEHDDDDDDDDDDEHDDDDEDEYEDGDESEADDD